MSAYYNEIDPKAAATLRELIREGLIAPGDVDERSIEDVKPNELLGYTQCHFFAGYGIWSLAFRLAGWPDSRPAWSGSCPCQPFSAAGKGAGFADERHVWPAWFHLIEHAKRPAVPVYGEQVASPDGLAWLDLVCADMEGANHTVRPFDLCSAGFGAPIIRQRLFWVASTSGVGRQAWRTSEPRLKGRDALAQHRSNAVGLASADNSQRRSDLACGDVLDGGEARRDEGNSELGANSAAVRVAGAKSGGSRTRLRNSGSTGIRRYVAADGCSVERMDESIREGLERLAGDGYGATGRAEQAGSVAQAGDISGMAIADGRDSGTEGLQRSGQHRLLAENGGTGDEHRGTSPTNGFWRDADWLRCRDGKWRPVEPRTFPLAYGYPERVGLLRGAGNAISPWVAKAFIEASEEALVVDAAAVLS